MPRSLAAVAFLFATLLPAGGQRAGAARPDWQAPYTPTKIEWLAVSLNAAFGADCTAAFGTTNICIATKYAVTAPDMITIFVDSYGPVSAKSQEKAVSSARRVVADLTRSLYGQAPPRIEVRRTVDGVESP